MRRSKIHCLFPATALAAALLAGAPARAGEWVRGAAAVTASDPGVVLQEVGGSVLGGEDAELPLYVSGLVDVESSTRAAIRLKTSNLIELHWSGPGYFAVERFDQYLETESKPERAVATGLSRMILNLRSGLLVIDSTRLANASQLIVEMPVGRMALTRAEWQVRIEYDEGSRLYDFSIDCFEGTIAFTDRRGERYDLRAGQRLGGVGKAGSPAVEVSEISREAVELVEELGFSEGAAFLDGLSWERLRGEMEVLDFRLGDGAAGAATQSGDSTQGRRRRFVIEYAPPAEPVTPFQGVVRPPSAYESDLY